MSREHYLKRELYELVKSDSQIFEFLQSGSLDGIFYWDLEEPEHEWMSPRFWQVLGFDSAEKQHLASEWQDLIDPEDLKVALENFEKHCADTNHPYDQIVRYRHKNGAIVWVRCRGLAIRDASGRPVRFLGAHTDVTALKLAETTIREQELDRETLRESERRFRQLSNSLPQLVWTCTEEGFCDFLSQQWVDYTGIAELEQLGFGWVNQLHPEDREPAIAAWQDAVAAGKDFYTEFRIRRHDGVYRSFDARAVRLDGARGKANRWVGSNTDITESKLAAEALQLGKEAAETASRSKSEFVANISHEFRTPLNAIIGMTSVLLDCELEDHVKHHLETIRTSGDVLLGIVNGILDFSKLESGDAELERQPFDIRQCVEESMRLVRTQAEAKGLELRTYFDKPLGHCVGDVSRLRLILVNLLGNAVKFTSEGSVTLEVSSQTSKDDNNLLSFAVIDTGAGIAPEHQSKLFEPFQQIDASLTRQGGGTGLGLTISKRLAGLLGGIIEVESEVGAGSKFTLTIPIEGPISEHSEFDESNSPMARELNRNLAKELPLKILVVEDNAVNQLVIDHLLHAMGYRPDPAGNGLEALEALERQHYDLILMDIQMPVLDGLSATKLIRERFPEGPRIVALTAGADQSLQQQCIEAGMNDYLTKPVQVGELEAALSNTRQALTG